MRRLVIILILVAFSGFAKRVPPAETFQGRGMKIGSVTLSKADLPPERENRAERIELEDQTKARIEEKLRQRQLFDASSPIALQVHINDFRLRHGATRFFTGFWSGSDRIGAQLTITDGSSTLLSKPLVLSGGNGNPFAISSRSRGANLSNALAELAVASLQRDAVTPQLVVASAPSIKTEVSTPQGKEGTIAGKTGKASCSVDQILLLNRSGLSDKQIQAACADEFL